MFKKAIKHLKNRFTLLSKNQRKDPSEKEFLEYYFGETAKRENIKLEYFQDPLVQKYRKRNILDKNSSAPKSINIRYFTLISKSNLFIADFLEYINGDLLSDSMKEVPGKFCLIFKKYLSSDKLIAKNYFSNNKRCKLPWSFFEVGEAIHATKQIIQNIFERQLIKTDISFLKNNYIN